MHKSPFASALFASAILTGALTLGLAANAHAADKDKSKNTVSRELAKPLKAAQEDLQKKKYEEALSKLKEAQANPKKTPYDEHIINELSLYAYAKTNNLAAAAKAMEATLDDGFTEPAEQNRDLKELAGIYYQLKDYGKAAQFGERAIKAGVGDANTVTLVSQAYYLKGDYKNTLKFTEDQVSDEIKRGETPKENQLQLVLSSCIKLNDQACTTRALERMVTYYPKPEYWQNLVDSLFQSKQAANSDADTLNIYRLANDVNAMQKPQEYTEMAQLAIEQGSPGEAQQVLEKAFAKNIFTDPRAKERNQRLLATAKKQAASDQASLAKLEQDAAKATNGNADVALGTAYLGYQQYDKAIQALQQGLSKGGLKNEEQARLLLGIAQLKGGKKDDAVKTFKSVKGSDPTLERLANLWTVHAREAGNAVASR
jgi:hypothetical protein